MFTPAERERVRNRLVELATSDKRLVSAALVGSLAGDEWDEWSDVDLTFGVDDGFALEDALEDWTRTMVEEFDAVQLFDLSVRGTTYRVFLLDDWLQVDLSFTPASEFRQRSPKFKLLWGHAHDVGSSAPVRKRLLRVGGHLCPCRAREHRPGEVVASRKRAPSPCEGGR